MSPDSVLSVRTRRVLDVTSLALLAIGVVALGLHNLSNHYFWTDESSTFFAGLGWPAPGETLGDLSTAWQGTMSGFLDPGLFHMLVRVWATAIGTGIVELRLLPFLFFLLYVASLLGVFRMIGAPWFLAAGGTSLIMFENITPYYAVEVRPYSAGLAASVALPLVALWLIKAPTYRRLIFFILAVALLGSMQYNTMPITWAVTVALGWTWWRTKHVRERAVLAIGAIVCLLWLPIFYLVSRGSPIGSSRGGSLGYISDLVLTSMPLDRLLHVVLTNFLSPTGVARTVFLVLVPLLWWRGWLEGLRGAKDWLSRALNLLWLLVLTATAATIVLAVAGFIPWILGTRWSIAEVGLIGLSVAGLSGVLLRSALWSRKSVVAVMGVVCVVLSAGAAVRLFHYERPNDVDFMEVLGPVVLSGNPGGTVIDTWSYPDARYWMEFSGEHDELRDAWIAHGVQPTEGNDSAGPEQIREFLASDNDRMLLRSAQVLAESGVTIPSSIQVVSVPEDFPKGPVTTDFPVVLVKP